MTHFEQAAVNVASVYRYLQELAATMRLPYDHRITLEFDRDFQAWHLRWTMHPLREDLSPLFYVRLFPELELGHIRDSTDYVIAAAEQIYDTACRAVKHFYEQQQRMSIGIVYFPGSCHCED